MSENITIARPYAQAIFQEAIEKNNLAHWEKMLVVATQISATPTMKSILFSDKRSEQIAQLFIDIAGDQLDESGRNLIKVMAYHQRLSLLSEVLALFLHYRQEREKRIEVQVISAISLTEKQLTQIQQAMEKRFEKSVQLSEQIDPSLISGFILRADDLVIDYSIKGRLDRLSVALQS